MTDGYIKLYRKAIDNGWLKNHELWAFWCWCLLKASHKNCVIMVGYQRVELKPGQFVFGRKKASEELNLSERKIRTCCSTLQNLQNMTIKTTNKYSIVSLINWDTYQVDNLQNDQQTANKRPTNDQQTTTNKNGKNVKNPPLSPQGELGDSHSSNLPKHTSRKPQGNPNIKIFIDWYSDRFLSIFQEKPVIEGGKDGAIVKRLLGTYGIDKLKSLAEAFFESDDDWIQQTGYTLGVFSKSINKVIAQQNNPKTQLSSRGIVSRKTERTIRMLDEWAKEGDENDKK